MFDYSSFLSTHTHTIKVKLLYNNNFFYFKYKEDIYLLFLSDKIKTKHSQELLFSPFLRQEKKWKNEVKKSQD